MYNCLIILELLDESLYIGWIALERFISGPTFVLLLDRSYHAEGLDKVLIAHKVVKEMEVLA